MVAALSRSARYWGMGVSAHPTATVGTSNRHTPEAPTRPRAHLQHQPKAAAATATAALAVLATGPAHQERRAPGPSRASAETSESNSSASAASEGGGPKEQSLRWPARWLGSIPQSMAVGSSSSSADSTQDGAATPKTGSWLTEQLDSLSSSSRTSRVIGRSARLNPNQKISESERRKHLVPRSVLFADGEAARHSDDLRPRKASNSPRKRLDRTPLTKQEANAFMSLLNQALAGTSTVSSAASMQGDPAEDSSALPFGSYTSLISNPKTQTGSKALLQAFAKRNRIQRFEAGQGAASQKVRKGGSGGSDRSASARGGHRRGARTHRHVRKSRRAARLCQARAESDARKPKTAGPKYGKDTPYYSSVLQLLFVAIRDRYRAPHVALSLPRVTRSLGIESYVLGVTGLLYNERRHMYGGALDDVLGGAAHQAEMPKSELTEDWSHTWLLANADEASALAGQPFRLLQREADGADPGRATGPARGYPRKGNRPARDNRESRDRTSLRQSSPRY
ncbi:hypothetical protein L1887_55494 [Cichorium endivia]|nr:hypothetical protein L1887_55494 [Cichorium endivia]